MDNIRTFKDLYNFLINYSNNNNIIEWLELKENTNNYEKQESLLRLFASLKLINKLNNYTICNGNFNKITVTPLNSYKDIFYDELNNEIKLKDSGDKSDLHGISIIEKDKIILATTSKNLKKENINKFDLRDISDLYQKYYKNNGWKLHICVCIKNIEKTKKMILKAKEENNDLKILLNDKNTIFIDWNDLNNAYINFKSIFKNISFDELINNNNNKQLITFKYHQKLSIIKTIELKNKNQKQILWGHIPRSGKSYIMAGVIIEDNKNNYLIITTAPNETIEQYLKILDCIQLKEYNIIYLNRNNNNLIKDKNIIICSKQYLQNKNISWLKNIIFDIRFIDESHNGGTTELAKNILNNYSKDSFTIQITATYSKPSNDFNISKDNWILWSLEDINLCKYYNLEKIIEKHGNLELINNYSKEEMINEYSKYPDLYILTEEIKPDIKQNIINLTKNNNNYGYGYSTEAIFLLKQGYNDKENEIKYLSEFQNEEENLKLWYKIFDKYDNDNNNENIFINRIKKICKNSLINSRFIYDNESYPYIIMVYLPQNNISKISKATIKLLNKYNVVPYLEIVSINSKTTNNPKQLIEETRIKAKNNNKKGVLVLSGKQCSLGISIKRCDIVILLNNNTSFDMIYQMMFRCMTEEENKKCGFVIDLNINRVINTSIIDYGFIIKPEQHPKETIKYLLEEKLINLNADHWMPCFGHNYSKIKSIIDNIYNIYSSNTENALEKLLNRLNYNYKNIILEDREQKLLNSLFTISKNKKSKKIESESLDLDLDLEKIKNGIEKTKIENDNNNQENNDNQEKNKEVKVEINYIEILKHIIPLICLLTIKEDNKTEFIEMFNYIKENKNIYKYNILLDQINSWYCYCYSYNKKNTDKDKDIDKDNKIFIILINIYIKYMKTDKEINNIIRTIKELFTKNINNSNELSKLIDKYLIPEELEKKKNAEVSTPYKLRQEMLDKIPLEFWSKPRKVFEPCSGKGGFLVDIVGRFMEGLKNEIPDEKERYRVIVEECLYWSDINPTNIYIGKLLLDPLEEYKLNYNEGDTLKLDIKTKFNIDIDINGFDAVIGNPPYNASQNQNNENKRGGGDLLWNKFVIKSLNEWLIKEGYLLFVHPSGWRKPESKLSKYKNLFKLMTYNNQMLYLEIHNTKDGMNVFKCGTRYDWYIIKKIKKYKNTIIKDEVGIINEIDMEKWEFIPNKNLNLILKLLAKTNEDKCEVIYNVSNYETRKKWISKERNEEFKYTCIHSTPKSGIRYMYSKINTNGHFGISKVIFGETGINNAIIDINGEYGMTQHSIGIKIDTLEEGEEIKEIIESIKFKDIIESCSWSNYQIDWRLFTYFKKDFYKELI